MPDKETGNGTSKPSEPSRDEQAQKVVQEYIDDLRAFLEKVRKHLK
jgi:hypothetical protein